MCGLEIVPNDRGWEIARRAQCDVTAALSDQCACITPASALLTFFLNSSLASIVDNVAPMRHCRNLGFVMLMWAVASSIAAALLSILPHEYGVAVLFLIALNLPREVQFAVVDFKHFG
jgi:hypothetical protein